MRKYTVEVTELRAYCVRYVLEALDEDEAKELALRGHGHSDDIEGTLIEVRDREEPEIIRE